MDSTRACISASAARAAPGAPFVNCAQIPALSLLTLVLVAGRPCAAMTRPPAETVSKSNAADSAARLASWKRTQVAERSYVPEYEGGLPLAQTAHGGRHPERKPTWAGWTGKWLSCAS